MSPNISSPAWGAPIVSFEEFEELRPKLGKIVATSGGFDPIHPGHISCIIQSKSYGDTLVVIVNGDAFLTAKKGRPFQNLETRSLIVSGVVGVDYVIPFEIDDDQTVSKALEAIKPILNGIALQLFAYYVAVEKGLHVDRPRNLAKSVTVE